MTFSVPNLRNVEAMLKLAFTLHRFAKCGKPAWNSYAIQVTSTVRGIDTSLQVSGGETQDTEEVHRQAGC
jgi:hypothetical protein